MRRTHKGERAPKAPQGYTWECIKPASNPKVWKLRKS